MTKTFPFYIARSFFVWFFGVLSFVSVMIIMFSLIELLRRTSGRSDVNFAILFRMACFQLPQIINFIMPFIYLSASILTVWFLNRSLEFVVARASGYSIWQFLLSFLAAALTIIVVDFTVFNPIGATFSKRYDNLESRFIHKNPNRLSLSEQGLWLRQKNTDGYTLVTAGRLSENETQTFKNISFFNFDQNDRFLSRVDAKRAILKKGAWHLKNVMETQVGALTSVEEDKYIPTDFTFDKIRNSFAPPHTISVWAMHGFIKLVEKAGFSARKHKLYWYATLSRPLLYLAMVMVSLPLALILPRRGGAVRLIVGSVAIGFFLYIMIDVLYTLGLSGAIPVLLAACLPSLGSALLGLLMLLHVEKG